MAKKIGTYVLVFLLILLITASTACIILSTTLLNKNLVTKMLANENYSSKTYYLILEKFKDNTIQSGLEETVLDGIMTKEEVEQDVRGLINYIYTGSELKTCKENVKTRLTEKINAIIEQNNKRVTSEEQKEIDIYINTIADIYENGILLSKDIIPMVHSAVESVQSKLNTISVIVYILTIIAAGSIIMLHKRRYLKFLSISLMSAGVLVIVPKIIEAITMRTQHILVFNMSLSNVVINMIERIMLSFLISGIVIISLGVIANIFYCVKKSRKSSENSLH